VSRVHADIEATHRGFLIKDAGSRHGSFVNGQPITSVGSLAEYGSIVRFGETLMLVADDIEIHRGNPRRLEGVRIGLPKDMVAGPRLAQVWDQATRIAALKDPVLILGESGSGKECIARIIHAMRATQGPFVGINVSAIPESLFEAELFGYERGAFTGATAARNGAFRDASGGVLFLDEVGDLRPDLQSKLLRAVDLGSVRPIGSSRDIQVDVRLVAATSRDLREACQTGAFRTDLYYRLMGIVVRVPPLRERREDIVLLALDILDEEATGLELSGEAAEKLVLGQWEGNVRNLRYAIVHAIARAIATGSKQLRPEHLPDLTPIHEERAELTEERIRWAMKQSAGVASHAAEALGVSRTTLYHALKRLGIEPAALRTK
jgi:transcriptional regulator with PAS, ATPase and Fis domain